MSQDVYVLDSSVFIQAANGYYAFDIAPGFWSSLMGHAQGGRVVSIDHVLGELRKGDDELMRWADREFRPWFRKTDSAAVVVSYGKVMEWVQQQSRFTEAAKAQFADCADGWLVAYAMAEDCLLVTQEVGRPESRRRVFIPDVCTPFGVTCLSTFQMMRESGIRLT